MTVAAFSARPKRPTGPEIRGRREQPRKSLWRADESTSRPLERQDISRWHRRVAVRPVPSRGQLVCLDRTAGSIRSRPRRKWPPRPLLSYSWPAVIPRSDLAAELKPDYAARDPARERGDGDGERVDEEAEVP